MKLQKAPNLNFPSIWKSESCSDELFNSFNNGEIVEVDSFSDMITLPEGELVYVINLYEE